MKSFASLILSAFLVSAHADDKMSAPFHPLPAKDVSSGGVEMPNRDELRLAPITIECWARLHDAADYNIIVASDTKPSSQHWELFTVKDKGTPGVWLTGRGGNFIADGSICDDAWHYLAVVLDKDQISLYVDGQLVKNGPMTPLQGPPVPGNIAIGQLVKGTPENHGCNGLIQDVRISKGVREIKGMPSAPFTKDATTLELWPLNK